MWRVRVKKERGPPAEGSILIAMACCCGAGRVTRAAGEMPACATTQTAQSGWARFSKEWVWATWMVPPMKTSAMHRIPKNSALRFCKRDFNFKRSTKIPGDRILRLPEMISGSRFH